MFFIFLVLLDSTILKFPLSRRAIHHWYYRNQLVGKLSHFRLNSTLPQRKSHEYQTGPEDKILDNMIQDCQHFQPETRKYFQQCSLVFVGYKMFFRYELSLSVKLSPSSLLALPSLASHNTTFDTNNWQIWWETF